MALPSLTTAPRHARGRHGPEGTPPWGSGDRGIEVVAPAVSPWRWPRGHQREPVPSRAGCGGGTRALSLEGGHWLCPMWGHRQQTGGGHSSALPWSPPRPSAAPPVHRDGMGGHLLRHLHVLYIYTAGPPPAPASPRVWGGSEEPWGQAGHVARKWGCSGAARGSPASCCPPNLYAPPPALN